MSSIGTANEKGTAAITCAFTDEDGDVVVPSSIVWTLTNEAGTVINSREQVAVAVPAASTTITLSGDDLAILTAEVNRREVKRYLVVEITYNSDLGSGLPGKDEGLFILNNLRYIT